MPTLNFGFDGADDSINEGFDSYDGPMPPNGSYNGVLKIAKVVKMKKDSTKRRIQILVEITDKDYKGYPAWGGVNLTEQGIPYVNQWLRSLVGSDEEFQKIHKVFFGRGPVVDEKKENILKIGTVKINSPEGSTPVKVTLKQRTYEGKTSASVQAFLFADGGSTGGSSDDDVIEEDGDEPELGGDDEGVADDQGDDEDYDAEDEDGDDDGGTVDESVFEEEEDES